MAVSLYDEAFLKKLKYWTDKTNIHIYGTSEIQQLIKTIADETNDTPIALPIISLTRSGGYDILNMNNKPMVYDGKMIAANYDKSISLNAIPISITYQIDVWTKYFKEADEYMRNLIFNIITYSKLNIEFDYNKQHIMHQSSLHLATGVLDTSSEAFRLTPGTFTRLSVGVVVDDAYLWDLRVRDNVHMSAGITITD